MINTPKNIKQISSEDWDNFLEKINNIALEDSYLPQEKDEYMNMHQIKYFFLKLLEWKDVLQKENEILEDEMNGLNTNQKEEIDQAMNEFAVSVNLRSCERNMTLIKQIDSAIERMVNQEYGYCLETGEEIGIKRLQALPIASYTIAVQEEIEAKARAKHALEGNVD